MSDLISRRDAIDAIYERIKQIGYEHNHSILSILQAIREVSSAEPTRCQHCKYAMAVKNQIVEEVKSAKKTGKWIKEKHHHKDQFQEFDYYTIHCSICGSDPEKAWHLTPFCPNCGSRMLEEGGEDDE